MRLALSLAAALLLSTACHPASVQETADAPSPQTTPKAQHAAPPTGHITGTVLCGDTHRPARGAMVMVVPAPDKGKEHITGGMQSMTRVAMDGTYEASRLSAGEYIVLAMLPGYLSPLDDLIVGEMKGDPSTVLEKIAQYGRVAVRDGGTARFDLTLDRGAAVSGRVLYSDGSPATQVNIDLDNTAKRPSTGSPEDNMNAGTMLRTLFTHQSASTDDQGRFRIAGLSPGRYRVAAVQLPSAPLNDREGMAMMWGMVADPHSLRVYSGDTLHKKEATVYDLHSGDEVSDINVTLPVETFHAVHGTLTAKDGRPLNMGSLTLTDTTDDSLVFHTELQRDGGFVFPTVPSGTYTLAASQGRIGKPPAGMSPDTPPEYVPLQPTDAFADGNIGVMVKNSDVTDVVLALDAMALPKDDQPPPPDAMPHPGKVGPED